MDWKILFYTVIVICLLYLYLSVFVVAYSIWKDRDLDKEPIWRVKILNEYFFFIGAWFALGFFFWGGFEKALFFLPDSWGFTDEEGYWTSFKTHFSILLSSLVSLLVISQATNMKKFYRDKRRLNKR